MPKEFWVQDWLVQVWLELEFLVQGFIQSRILLKYLKRVIRIYYAPRLKRFDFEHRIIRGFWVTGFREERVHAHQDKKDSHQYIPTEIANVVFE